MVQLSYLYMTTGKTSFDYTGFCWYIDVQGGNVFSFMAAVIIHIDFRAQENKMSLLLLIHFYFPWSDRTGYHDFSFLNVEI